MDASTRQHPAYASEDAARALSRSLGEPAWLLEDRLQALKRHQALPLESNPLFTKHTERLRGLEALQTAAMKPGLKGPTAKGVRFGELGEALRDPQGLKDGLLNDLPGFEQDQVTNLPRALFGTGTFLHVPDGVQVEEVFHSTYTPPAGAAFARNVYVLGAGARATVLEEVAPGEGAKGLLGLTSEVLLGPGAELRLLGYENGAPGHTTIVSRQARAMEDARLEMHHAFTGSSLVKGRSDVALLGRGSRVQQSEVVFGNADQRFDLNSRIAHLGPDTTSDALSKAVLREQSRANLKGIIHIAQEGKDSDSWLAQHAMLLSRKARCIAIPSLEIINREIKRCKHAATVAQVPEDQVFYLETRGLSEEEARKSIVMGFLGPLLDRLGESTAERVRGQIEAKWA